MPLSLKRPVWRALSITHRFSLRCAISATSIGNQLIHEPSCVDHLIGIAPWTLAVSNCGGHGQKEIDDADQHPPQGVRTGLTEGMSSFLNPSDIGWTDQHGNPRPWAPTRAEVPGALPQLGREKIACAHACSSNSGSGSTSARRAVSAGPDCSYVVRLRRCYCTMTVAPIWTRL
jgi:hypothetical protein